MRTRCRGRKGPGRLMTCPFGSPFGNFRSAQLVYVLMLRCNLADAREHALPATVNTAQSLRPAPVPIHIHSGPLPCNRIAYLAGRMRSRCSGEPRARFHRIASLRSRSQQPALFAPSMDSRYDALIDASVFAAGYLMFSLLVARCTKAIRSSRHHTASCENYGERQQ